MAWFFLVLAGGMEMIGVTMINRLHRNRDWKSFMWMLAGFTGSFIFLALAMKDLPMGTAYAVWTGIGAAGGAIAGMLFYGEPKHFSRIFFITLVLGAAVGLKLVS
ncbi:QacE family quaternary ammonium compound efflux SMR transporter [Kroppenstedtia guangzhouensis]|jgi:paired small multidrug resistance pump|uniref:QacE family quaternary ammonium compound efflux SMR transporter n=1 Tax=Kroppenstedtia guangzhouensis TaxID=1274356 RepID=A0ABQ1GE13_9BACL|nr:multidrug efflux SMR transporter [Kroppenstedtia guangzhouensis]GGA41853.1 QacE family quaternary ammonium compound efflux SMR transporter [Kroppenstedtia guangzhouensis]